MTTDCVAWKLCAPALKYATHHALSAKLTSQKGPACCGCVRVPGAAPRGDPAGSTGRSCPARQHEIRWLAFSDGTRGHATRVIAGLRQALTKYTGWFAGSRSSCRVLPTARTALDTRNVDPSDMTILSERYRFGRKALGIFHGGLTGLLGRLRACGAPRC